MFFDYEAVIGRLPESLFVNASPSHVIYARAGRMQCRTGNIVRITGKREQIVSGPYRHRKSLSNRLSRLKPAPIDFEMAYQVRVAMDRIRFAIKQIEQFSLNSGPGQETGFQLVDALDRLEAADRHFQLRFHSAPPRAVEGSQAK